MSSKYLTRVPRGNQPESVDLAMLNTELDTLIHDADGEVLGIQSPMGSGKTMMLSECIS